MENNTNNTSPAHNTMHQSGGMQGNSHNAGNQPQGSAQASNTATGMGNQQATSGKGGLGDITDKLQQFCSSTMDKVGNLSTTQKVVGGSVLALGAGWIAMNSMNKKGSKKEKMRENVRKRN